MFPGGRERSAPHGLEPDALLFCPHCSAPQIRYPEHMRPLAAEAEATATTGSAPPPNPHSIDWPTALKSGAVVALVGAVLHIVGSFFLLVSVIAFVWVTSCALFTLSQYARQRPEAWMDARTGMRIGVAAALLTVAALGPAIAATGVVQRYVTHSMGEADVQTARQTRDLDERLDAGLKQQGVTAQQGKYLVDFFNAPETWAGSAVALAGFSGLVLVLLSAGTGALAGAAGARKRRLVLGR